MIRPFELGDIFLIQRLRRQATKLNIVQALLQPHSPTWAAFSAVNPWDDAKVATYVLHQSGHDLARAGYLQARKRPDTPETELTLLAPALDMRAGHPAIWEKLLAHYCGEAAQRGILRIFADVPDQPLPVNTFAHVGFSVFERQTIWRLASHAAEDMRHLVSANVRPQNDRDEWELLRLYARVVPPSVQMAEGALTETTGKAPIVSDRHVGAVKRYVFEMHQQIDGCIQVTMGHDGIWLDLWADTLQPNATIMQQLLAQGMTAVRNSGQRLPVYLGVADHQGGMDSILSSFGFAPFTDIARMAKQMMQRIVDIETSTVRASARELDTMPEGVVAIGGLEHRNRPSAHNVL